MSTESFITRHLGPRNEDIDAMLSAVGVTSIHDLLARTIPKSIRLDKPLNIPQGMTEYQYFKRIKKIASKNKVFKSYIGLGYYNTAFPAVIQRNILENPSWYTSYTPYQAEISQGRLEALLNYQTMVADLTAMELANASLLDESTAAAEAMIMLYNARSREQQKNGVLKFFIDEHIFPQTLAVLETRAEPLGIELVIAPFKERNINSEYFGTIVQYPNSNGKVCDYTTFTHKAHETNCAVVVAADLLALSILAPPGEWGADVVIGSSQRFGLPMGFGGPHAGYFATKEKYKRFIPGRIIGVSKDKHDKPALRMALQTREQHIKRERATSNICTAQALLATMAGMYAVYHGKDGLTRIARHCHNAAGMLSEVLNKLGYNQINEDFFDTLKIRLPKALIQQDIRFQALEREINLNYFEDGSIGVSLDETISVGDLNELIEVFAAAIGKPFSRIDQFSDHIYFNDKYKRNTDFLTSAVFSKHRSETEMMRYIKRLERKDLSLTDSMISLGSCTMKLNAAIELFPLSWPEFGEIHPFVPIDQTEGYQQIIHELGKMLNEITGLAATSFQPNSGAAGEYAGLMVIRKYHEKNGDSHKNIVLIPSSAHGTNPASAVMAGMKVVVVKCDDNGNIDLNDLREKVNINSNNIAALMVTYPSTHGVFEQNILDITNIMHNAGAQVYMDGANMNAQVGLTNPAIIGADVCHLNLHKTFAIPHGGGGPGAGPICVADHLVEFLPGHPIVATGGVEGMPAISAAPWGSASILTISHAYCNLLGADGLRASSEVAILNANYIANKLKEKYGIVYSGETGFVAHELILECRHFKKLAGITELDIAKRLMDYGYHAPTLSFPVHGTLMIEPTESESKAEIDRFIEVMQQIYCEIMEIAENPNDDNVLKNAPHCLEEVCANDWNHAYTRQKAAYPLKWLYEKKYWTPSSRIDDAYGDRNLICDCEPIQTYES